MTILRRTKFFWGQPVDGYNAGIQRPTLLDLIQTTIKSKTQIGDVARWNGPLINPDERPWRDMTGCFLEGLTLTGSHQRLTLV